MVISVSNRVGSPISGLTRSMFRRPIGGLAGLAALIKFRWNRIRASFSKERQEETNG
jgi:hypothetical protein